MMFLFQHPASADGCNAKEDQPARKLPCILEKLPITRTFMSTLLSFNAKVSMMKTLQIDIVVQEQYWRPESFAKGAADASDLPHLSHVCLGTLDSKLAA